ncbi:MAG TPA: GNAT family N-acetyltransferase [Candidatus Limnocylindrales bacterium]|nr:GNAT family N-acetyltransferase [Candidatus Limnocylindrales bacterium]
MRIDRATTSDVPAVEALLAAAGLPLEGAAEALSAAVVARVGDRVVGAAAVEPYGSAGLLRSVVVAEPLRGTGLGRELVAAAEALARERGIRDLYLITETAASWFPRHGYIVVDREVARAAVGDSIEFTMACATTGVPMRHSLG